VGERDDFCDAGEPKRELFREALSARLDGEDEPMGAAALDAHLAECAACRRWWDDAAAVTRLVRTGPALAGIDVTDAVLPAAPGRWRSRLAVGLRLGLGLLGFAQLALGILQVTALRVIDDSALHETAVDGATPGHLWHESAAWNVAIGGGFLWIAARRARPVGVVPMLTVFIGVLVVLSGADVVAGRVEPLRLASHGFVLVGYLIVLLLSRPVLDLTPPGHGLRGEGWRRARSAGDPPDRVLPFPGPDRSQPAARLPHREAA
jgi:predicted anti-sigma-YlaC factor YlaD